MKTFKQVREEIWKVKLTPEEQFDIIENVIEDIAKDNNIDSEIIWEELESIPDEELLEVQN